MISRKKQNNLLQIMLIAIVLFFIADVGYSMDRRAAVHRRRRIIVNDDNGAVYEKTANTAAGYIAWQLAYTDNTQMDSFWLSINGHADSMYYDAHVGEICGQTLQPQFLRESNRQETFDRYKLIYNNIKSLAAAGAGPLKLSIDYNHTRNHEVFASVRMNMFQDSWVPDFFTQFKRDHPEYCLGTRSEYGKSDLYDLYWSVLDYAQKPVRDFRFDTVNDLITRFDVDGVELDFYRYAMFFKPSLDDKPVGQQNIDLMTGLIRRIRNRMTERETQRNRPLLLAVRVPDTEATCRKVGLDPRAWLNEGLIDILVVGGCVDFYSIPVTDWAELAHKHDVPLYICKYRGHGLNQDRAIAAWYLSCGADGIYNFNDRYPDDLPSLCEIGDSKTLARKDKLYIMSEEKYKLHDHIQIPGVVPFFVTPGKPVPALMVGDDIAQAAAQNSLLELKLMFAIKPDFTPEEKQQVTFLINGREIGPVYWMPKGHGRASWTELEWKWKKNYKKNTAMCFLDTKNPQIKQGVNTLDVKFPPGFNHDSVKIKDLYLWVRYK